MSTEMTIVLTIAYFLFWVWGYSRKAQPSVAPNTKWLGLPNTPDGYINYFPDIEEEEESLINSSFVADPSSIPIEVEFDYYAFTGMVELMSVSVTATDVRHLATQAAVIDDPWTLEVEPIELEFNVVQLEYQLALPPAQDVIEEDPESQCAEDSLNYDIAQYHLMLSLMNIRQLKAEAKRVKLPRYGNMKKAELLVALKAFTV